MDLTIDPVRLPPRPDGPSVSSVLVAIAIVLVVAIVKPWGTADEAGVPIGTSRPARTEAPVRTPAPTPDVARQRVAALCLEPNGWRLYATERWSDRGVRSWKSIEPVAFADGPGDPRIPMFLEASQTVLTLGYCAPVTGLERPPSQTTTTIYRLAAAGGPGGDSEWEIIEPARAEPVAGSSPLGGAWAPPRIAIAGASSSVEPRGWPSGTYVFRIAGVGSAETASRRWFGVVVEVTPSAIP
jgi:hypothetical protein